MKTIPAQLWIRITHLALFLIVPASIYLVWSPVWMLDKLCTALAYITLIGIASIGVIVAIAEKLGFFQWQWDEETKKSMHYKMRLLQQSMRQGVKAPRD